MLKDRFALVAAGCDMIKDRRTQFVRTAPFCWDYTTKNKSKDLTPAC